MTDIETIKEMWELTEGGEMPKEFMSTVTSFQKHKCAFQALPFTESDFAACVMNYKLYKALGAQIAKKRGGEDNGK